MFIKSLTRSLLAALICMPLLGCGADEDEPTTPPPATDTAPPTTGGAGAPAYDDPAPAAGGADSDANIENEDVTEVE